jgi:nicotinamidase-related amidase
LLVVDVQERLTPVMTDPRRVIHHCGLLLRFARHLAIPALASEQYPQGLGPTMADLREWLQPGETFAKIHFSCADDRALAARVAALDRPQIVLAGIEAHVCVLQTAIDLAALGHQVYVVADACASRRAESEAMAWQRLRQASVTLVTLEMVLFEWLRQAGTADFKALSSFVR